MGTKHSPLPWTYDDDGFIRDADGGRVIDPHCFTLDTGENDENALLLVNAVNSHADLLEACKNLLCCITSKGELGGAYATFSGDDIRKANAAIAKAEVQDGDA